MKELLEAEGKAALEGKNSGVISRRAFCLLVCVRKKMKGIDKGSLQGGGILGFFFFFCKGSRLRMQKGLI